MDLQSQTFPCWQEAEVRDTQEQYINSLAIWYHTPEASGIFPESPQQKLEVPVEEMDKEAKDKWAN